MKRASVFWLLILALVHLPNHIEQALGGFSWGQVKPQSQEACRMSSEAFSKNLAYPKECSHKGV